MKNYISKAGEPDQIVPRNGAVDKVADLLNQLLDRGVQVSIEGGKLVLIPANGNPLPSDWLDVNESELAEQIAVQTGAVILRYTGYSTANFGQHLAPGVALQFESVSTEHSPYVVFNCLLTRDRTTRHGKAGTPLPKRHFRLNRKHKLRGFLKLAGVEIRSLSVAHESMGRLKGILFAGRYINEGKLYKDSIMPLNMSPQQVIDLAQISQQDLNKGSIKVQQPFNKSSIRNLNTESPETHTGSDSQPFPSACPPNHVKRTTLQGDTVTRVTTTPPICTPKEYSEGKGKSVRNQTHKEWLSDYDDLINQ
jgi:hypothetical protein